jgi:AraC family transcriptional regulator, alkane utilization regulator
LSRTLNFAGNVANPVMAATVATNPVLMAANAVMGARNLANPAQPQTQRQGPNQPNPSQQAVQAPTGTTWFNSAVKFAQATFTQATEIIPKPLQQVMIATNPVLAAANAVMGARNLANPAQPQTQPRRQRPPHCPESGRQTWGWSPSAQLACRQSDYEHLTDGGPSTFLSEGDIIIFPHGDSHVLGDHLEQEPVLVSHLLPEPPWSEPLMMQYGGGGDVSKLVCGFLQCEEMLMHPFLKTLPRLIHVQAFAEPTAPLLEMGVRYIIQETECFRAGSMCSLTRLVELMFIEILRNYMQNLPAQEVGWLAALQDPIVSQALESIHADPAHAWTVPALANKIGLSRSALAARFTQLVGQSPMKYLTDWRLQLASRQLQDTADSIAKIAIQVGYESEAAFNRAFKRHIGVPPGVWRDAQRPALSNPKG